MSEKLAKNDVMENIQQNKIKVVVLADVPIWILPGLERYRSSGHYATWLESLIPEFKNIHELEMHWITFSKEVDKNLNCEVWNQTFHVLKRGKKSLSLMTGYYIERQRINSVISRLNPDVIHAWGTEDVYGLAGAHYKLENKIFSLQGCLKACLEQAKTPPFFMRVQGLYELKSIKSYSWATAESLLAIKHLKNMNSEIDARIVEYGVSKEFFDAEWNPSKNPELVFVGSVSQAKGILDLCNVMAMEGLSDVKLKVIGDSSVEIQERYGNNIEWLGRLSRTQLIKQMEKAWALIIPTYADTGPSVVKEARVVGLPVITTTAAGASTYIKDGKSGYVITPGDREDLHKSILKLVDSRNQCVAMGQHNWTLTRKSLMASSTARKFAKLYYSIFNNTPF